MENNPLVSIIVRTKDRPKLLKRALASIENQTYRPIEVVLVNDGGCDLDVEALRRILEDIPLNYIRLEKNRGRAHAGNMGIRNAAGEYVGFLDDDDAFYPMHVETSIVTIQESEGRISYTDAEIVHIGDIQGDGDIQETDRFPRESIDFSFETLLLQNYISFMTLLFEKAVLVEIGGFDENFELCEDWDLIIRLGSRYPFHHIRKITAKYTFWSKEHQVTIGNEKLSPYRLKMLSVHFEKISPEILYRLIYEGKWLGDLVMASTNRVLEEKIAELEKALTASRAQQHISDVGTPGENDGTGAHQSRAPDEPLPTGKSPSVSVILRVKNEGQTLERVITRIREQDYQGEVEIVVVDSGSTDNTLEIAERYRCKIVKLRAEDFTFGKALNIGYREAGGNIFVNLSGHTVPFDNSFLKELISPYEDPVVAATFGRNIPFPDACPSEAKDLDFWYPDKWIDVPERFSNGNASLRRSVWKEMHFDEEVSGSEDILWAQQVMKSGFQIVYVPTAAAYHSHSSRLQYAFHRRFRETKAIVNKGDAFQMTFRSFLAWTARQTLSDIAYAKKKHFAAKWYLHIPFYRFVQGAAIFASSRKRSGVKEPSPERLHRLKEKYSAYYRKSLVVLRDEGWTVFFQKVKQKLLRKMTAAQAAIGESHHDSLFNLPKFPTARKFTVLFIVDPVGVLTNYFRAVNVKEYLGHFHVESELMPETSLDYERASTFDIIVLCRVFMNPHVEKLVEMCRRLHIPVVFDADDYVIDPSIIDSIGSLESIPESEKAPHVEGLTKHRASFDAADFFTAPTGYLAEVGAGLGKRSFVIRNGLSSSQQELAEFLLRMKVPSSGITKIGYFSGTKTHQRDFAVVAPALLAILEEFPEVHLYIGGHLDLDSRFEKFSDRTVRLPFVPIEKLPYYIAKVDINIAPLEVNNAFCEGKSELKYFDAGILKIPTVASPTDAFRWAIRSGFNGYLASTTDEWHSSLKRLVEDAGRREKIGQRAYEHVTRYCSPIAVGSAAKETYETIIGEYRKRIGIPESALRISFVLPTPSEGSGGHNKIFSAARYLSEFGHSVHLYCLNDGTFGSRKQLRDFINSKFFDLKSEIILGTDTLAPCDVLCATSWVTAYDVLKKKDRAAKLFYFVQDFEPLFFPMSDNYLKAENTYRLGMHHITFGPWCAKILKERFEAIAEHIPFSLDQNVYYPRGTRKGEADKVLFFARPEMPRRCYWLGIEALGLFHRRNPGVKIALFGSNAIDSPAITFPHENLGVLSVGELSALYSDAAVGLAFSTTNPSLVPFEMMACGCPVIDFDYNDNVINYGSADNVKLVGISPEEISAGLEELIHDAGMRQRISENGLRFVSEFPDDRETFRAMERIFLKAFSIESTPVLGKAVGLSPEII